jgi:lysozyme family protein
MSAFQQAQDILAEQEGGWCDIAADKGGETNRGWSMLSILRFGIPPSELGIVPPWGDDTWAPFGLGCATILRFVLDGWKVGRSTQATLHALQAGLDPAKNEHVGPGRGILKPLTQALSDAAYLKHFWEPGRFALLADQRVATKLYSAGVNISTSEAVLLAQQTVNALGGQVVADGALGEHTAAAINGYDPQGFINAYSDTLSQHYRDICAHDPTQLVFLPNWLHRAAWGRT